MFCVNEEKCSHTKVSPSGCQNKKQFIYLHIISHTHIWMCLYLEMFEYVTKVCVLTFYLCNNHVISFCFSLFLWVCMCMFSFYSQMFHYHCQRPKSTTIIRSFSYQKQTDTSTYKRNIMYLRGFRNLTT